MFGWRGEGVLVDVEGVAAVVLSDCWCQTLEERSSSSCSGELGDRVERAGAGAGAGLASLACGWRASTVLGGL